MALRPQHAVDGDIVPHAAQKPLQDLHRIAACVNIHIENAWVERIGQPSDQRRVEIMPDEYINRVGLAQAAQIALIDHTVVVQVDPQSPHRVDRNAKICRPARIIGIIHKPAFTGHDVPRDVFDRIH